MKHAVKIWVLISSLGLCLSACGGGSGLGPTEIQKREDKLKEEVTTDWSSYGTGSYEDAIEAFTQTLEQADLIEGIEPGVKNQIKSEAQNGIGWSFFKTQSLDDASVAFRQATSLNGRNADAWAGWAGVSLAQKRWGDAAQFAVQTLDLDPNYNSANRLLAEGDGGRIIGHDHFDARHLRLLLAESYFQLGRYSAIERPDPNNAAAQVRLIRGQFKYRDPGHLVETIGLIAQELQESL